MHSTDLEVFVSHTTAAAVLDVLDLACGVFSHDSELGFGVQAYLTATHITLTLTEGLPGGFLGVTLAGASAWSSDQAFARFLSDRLGRPVRCYPGADYPDARWWQASTFLEVYEGRERLVDWQ